MTLRALRAYRPRSMSDSRRLDTLAREIDALRSRVLALERAQEASTYEVPPTATKTPPPRPA